MRLMQDVLTVALPVASVCAVAEAQDAMRGLDLTSPDMTMAEMTRAQVEAAIKASPSGRGPDFADKRLSGLNLSGLDLSGAKLARRAAQPREPLARQARGGNTGPGLGA